MGDFEGDQPVTVGVGELEGIRSLSSLETISILHIKVLIINNSVVVLENLDVDRIGFIDFLRPDIHAILVGVDNARETHILGNRQRNHEILLHVRVHIEHELVI